MLLLLLVLVLLHIIVLIGQTKLIAKSGMLTEGVLGMLALLVLNLTEINLVVSHNLAVLTRLRVVVEYEMNRLVLVLLAVLGVVQIALH